MDEILRTAGNVLIVYTFLASTAFCVIYHFSARWASTSFGRSLMLYQVSMSIVLGLSVFRITSSMEGTGFAILRLVIFVAVPLALTWRLVVMIRLQWRARKGDHK